MSGCGVVLASSLSNISCHVSFVRGVRIIS